MDEFEERKDFALKEYKKYRATIEDTYTRAVFLHYLWGTDLDAALHNFGPSTRFKILKCIEVTDD